MRTTNQHETRAKGSETMTSDTRTEGSETTMDVDKIKTELKEMRIGHCAVKWDCLVWRVSRTRYQVGSHSVSITAETMDAEEAALFIKLLNK